jgi:hypothetical protein
MKIGVVVQLSNKTADPAVLARPREERGFESFTVGEPTAVRAPIT